MSQILEAIESKKRGGELEEALISAVVEGYTAGEIPDYQMAALLMAIFINGMSEAETLALTRAMADSGERYSFPECVDKHSTGGIGDKISLTALPLAAACGAPVAKLSGRGLGHTGGTVDKLESIPGFSCGLSREHFERQVREIGLAIVEAGELAPADKAIYALRDVTGTVDSLPLISSSIVSKKAATGAGYLLYDVKRGSGAFMKTLEEARALARQLVGLSEAMGIRASAFISDMSRPLGSAVGNTLEIRESLRFLRGESVPQDLADSAREIARRLLALKGIEDGEQRIQEALATGTAHEKFLQFVAAQGGDADSLDHLPVSPVTGEITAPRAGYVSGVDALSVGNAALALGAGRERKSDEVDPGAGVELLVFVGDRVEAGQPVARLYGRRGGDHAGRLMRAAITIGEEPVEREPAILESL